MLSRQSGALYITTTPWASHEELLDVYSTIYNFNNPYAQKKALRVVAIWRTRSPKLSLSVEVTAALVSLHIAQLPLSLQNSHNLEEDARNQSLNPFDFDPSSPTYLHVRSPPTSESFLNRLQQLPTWSSRALPDINEMRWRFEYAIVLLRFVNGIVDVMQKKNSAISVSKVASSIGIPRLFVDIRHESTHNELPSLALLRLASGKALQWLNANYWEPQVETVSSLVAAAHASVRAYRDTARSYLTSSRGNSVGVEFESYKHSFESEWLSAVRARLQTSRREKEREERARAAATKRKRDDDACDDTVVPVVEACNALAMACAESSTVEALRAMAVDAEALKPDDHAPGVAASADVADPIPHPKRRRSAALQAPAARATDALLSPPSPVAAHAPAEELNTESTSTSVSPLDAYLRGTHAPTPLATGRLHTSHTHSSSLLASSLAAAPTGPAAPTAEEAAAAISSALGQLVTADLLNEVLPLAPGASTATAAAMDLSSPQPHCESALCVRALGDYADVTNAWVARVAARQLLEQRALAPTHPLTTNAPLGYRSLQATPTAEDGVPHYAHLYYARDGAAASGLLQQLQRSVEVAVAATDTVIAAANQLPRLSRKPLSLDKPGSVATGLALYPPATAEDASTTAGSVACASTPRVYAREDADAVRALFSVCLAGPQGEGVPVLLSAADYMGMDFDAPQPGPIARSTDPLPGATRSRLCVQVRPTTSAQRDDDTDTDSDSDFAPAFSTPVPSAVRLTLARDAQTLAQQHADLVTSQGCAPADVQLWSVQCSAAALRTQLLLNHMRSLHAQAVQALVAAGTPQHSLPTFPAALPSLSALSASVSAPPQGAPESEGSGNTHAASIHPFVRNPPTRSPAALAQLVYSLNGAAHTLHAALLRTFPGNCGALAADQALLDYLASLAAGPSHLHTPSKPAAKGTAALAPAPAKPLLPAGCTLVSGYQSLTPSGSIITHTQHITAALPLALAEAAADVVVGATGTPRSAATQLWLPPSAGSVERVLLAILPSVLVSKAHMLRLPSSPVALTTSHANIYKVLSKQVPAWMPLLRYLAHLYPSFQGALLWRLLHQLLALQEQWTPVVDASLRAIPLSHASVYQRVGAVARIGEYSCFDGLHHDAHALLTRRARAEAQGSVPSEHIHTAQRGYAMIHKHGGVDAWNQEVCEDTTVVRGAPATASVPHSTASPSNASGPRRWPSALSLRLLPADVRWLVAVIVEWVAVLAAPLELCPAQTSAQAATRTFANTPAGASGESVAYLAVSIDDVDTASALLKASSAAAGSGTPHTSAVATCPSSKPSLHMQTGASDLATTLLALQASTLPSAQHEVPLTQLTTLQMLGASTVAARTASACPPSQAPAAAYMDWLAAGLLLVRNDGPMATALRERLPALDAVCEWIASPAPSLSTTAHVAAASSSSGAELATASCEWQRASVWTPTPIGCLPGSRYPLLSSVRPSLPLDNDDLVNDAVHGDHSHWARLLSEGERAETYRTLVNEYRARNALCSAPVAPAVRDVDLVVRTRDAAWLGGRETSDASKDASGAPTKKDAVKRTRSKSSAAGKVVAAVTAPTAQLGAPADMTAAVSVGEPICVISTHPAEIDDAPVAIATADVPVAEADNAVASYHGANTAHIAACANSVDTQAADCAAALTHLPGATPAGSIVDAMREAALLADVPAPLLEASRDAVAHTSLPQDGDDVSAGLS